LTTVTTGVMHDSEFKPAAKKEIPRPGEKALEESYFGKKEDLTKTDGEGFHLPDRKEKKSSFDKAAFIEALE